MHTWTCLIPLSLSNAVPVMCIDGTVQCFPMQVSLICLEDDVVRSGFVLSHMPSYLCFLPHLSLSLSLSSSSAAASNVGDIISPVATITMTNPTVDPKRSRFCFDMLCFILAHAPAFYLAANKCSHGIQDYTCGKQDHSYNYKPD